LIQADAEVQSDTTIDGDFANEIASITVKGGGGTSHIPVFEHIKKEHGDARVVICFTDGCTEYPEEDVECGFDTIWAITTLREEGPFGKTVHVEVGEEKEDD
jgi:predicted metal-dependent peptidase